VTTQDNAMTADGYAICKHCEVLFLPTWRQRKRLRSKVNAGKRACCSPACGSAVNAASKRKPKVLYGPCPTCGERFESRYSGKKFCSLKCYHGSGQFKAHSRAAIRKATEASVRRAAERRKEKPTQKVAEKLGRTLYKCLECGVEWLGKRSNKRKFCSLDHYRAYMAKRFDRWIASPQKIALPQAYDEFLLQDELPCLVDGCDWVGQLLSNHMNFAHGVPADEFKRAAGFNLKTGVVGREVHLKMCERPHILLAFRDPQSRYNQERGHRAPLKHYCSLEGREHGAKGRILCEATVDPPSRICRSCGVEFKQSSPYGLTKYCSMRCRSHFYMRDKDARSTGECGICGTSFEMSLSQRKSSEKGNAVFCSLPCRQTHNGRFRRKSKVHAP